MIFHLRGMSFSSTFPFIRMDVDATNLFGQKYQNTDAGSDAESTDSSDEGQNSTGNSSTDDSSAQSDTTNDSSTGDSSAENRSAQSDSTGDNTAGDSSSQDTGN